MNEVALIGATFYGNRGAEAMLSASIGELRKRLSDATTFHVFSYYPEIDARLVVDPRIEIHSAAPLYLVGVLLPAAVLYWFFDLLRLRTLQRSLPRSARALAGSDVLICLAGISFVDGRTKFLPFNVATVLPALILGIPVVKFAQALGPFERRLNWIVSKLTLPRCRRIFARGAKTEQHLTSLHLTNWERADDVAFLYHRTYSLSRAFEGPSFAEGLARITAARPTRRVVGLCPSVVVEKQVRKSGGDYPALLQSIVDALVAEGHLVVLFPNATRGEDMNKTHNNDLPLLTTIYRRLSGNVAESTVLFERSLNVAQIHEVIASCDVVAVSRFHAMVGALTLAVPTVVLGWSHKYAEVMELFEQTDMVLDYGDGSAEAIVGRVQRLLAERAERSRVIQARLPAVKARTERQIAYVTELLAAGETCRTV